MREFRPSLRNTVATATILAFATWLILRVALRIDTRFATVGTVAALGALAALRLLIWRGTHALELTDEALWIRGRGENRRIEWDAIRQIQLVYGEVETPRGTATVQYARLQLSSGPPVAFADLSALDGAEVVLEQEPTAVYDVGDPEVLLGIVAERIGAREFLPSMRPAARRAKRSFLGGIGSILVCLRAGVIGVLTVSVAEVLWDASQNEVLAAVAGIMGAIALMSVLRVVGAQVRSFGGTEGSALAALSATALAATIIWQRAPSGEQTIAAAWGLSCALVFALPVAPLPGVALARALGHVAAKQSTDRLAAVFVALIGAVAALLLARGMRLIPLALVAAGAEGAEAYLASLRNTRLANAPRFADWSPEALSELRSMLRASYVDDESERQIELDRANLRRAESLRRTRTASLLLVLISIIAIAISGAVAKRVLHVGSGRSVEAIQLLLR